MTKLKICKRFIESGKTKVECDDLMCDCDSSNPKIAKFVTVDVKE